MRCGTGSMVRDLIIHWKLHLCNYDQGRLRPKMYDSKSKHSTNCKLNLGSGMLVFFLPFFENLGSYVYDSMRARTISAAIFSLRSCTACARVLSLFMRSARDGLAALGVLGGSAAKWTNVVWPIKSRPTNQQTNTHYSFIGIDEGHESNYPGYALHPPTHPPLPPPPDSAL